MRKIVPANSAAATEAATTPAPPPRRRIVPAQAAQTAPAENAARPASQEREEPQTPSAPAIQPTVGRGPAAQPPLDDWARSGTAGIAASEAAKQRAQEERSQRAYWPIRFYLKQQPGENQADVIILDHQPGPRYYEHAMRNPRTGFYDLYEPCPKEWDSCPLCPPNGEKDSYYVMLLTVLSLKGYTSREGVYVPVTKELLAVKLSDHQFFDQLFLEKGTLRGQHILMTRGPGRGANHGTPEWKTTYPDASIEELIKASNLWVPKVDRDGNEYAPADHMMHPFEYARFLKRPSGADLRARYGGAAPFGAQPTGGYGGHAGRGAPQQMAGGIQRFGRGPQGQGGFGAPPAGGDNEWGDSRFDPGNQGGQPWASGPDNVDQNLGWANPGPALDDDVPY